MSHEFYDWSPFLDRVTHEAGIFGLCTKASMLSLHRLEAEDDVPSSSFCLWLLP